MLKEFKQENGTITEGPQLQVYEYILVMCINSAVDVISGRLFPQVMWERTERRYFQIYDEEVLQDFFSTSNFDRITAELALHGLKQRQPQITLATIVDDVFTEKT